MHLEIDKLSFKGNRVGIDFEYDEDFRQSVAFACGMNYISQKELQNFIVNTIQEVVNKEELLKLRDEVN